MLKNNLPTIKFSGKNKRPLNRNPCKQCLNRVRYYVSTIRKKRSMG